MAHCRQAVAVLALALAALLGGCASSAARPQVPASLQDPEAIGPKVIAVGELKDDAGKVVATALVLQLPMSPDMSEQAGYPTSGGSASPFEVWMYSPVAVAMNGERRNSSRKYPVIPGHRPGDPVTPFIPVPRCYTVTVLFPSQLPKEAVPLVATDTPQRYDFHLPEPKPVELVIPEEKNRPMLPPLRASVVRVEPYRKETLYALIRMNWEVPQLRVLLDRAYVERVKIGLMESQGEINNSIETGSDGIRTPLLAPQFSNPPEKDAPISLKIRGVDAWVSTEPEKSP